MQWHLTLSDFKNIIKYKKGKVNNVAGMLARIPTDGHTQVKVDTEPPSFTSGKRVKTEHALLLDIQWCENGDTNSCGDDEENDLLEEDESLDELDDGIDFILATTASHPEPEPPARISVEEMLIEQQSDGLCRQVRDEIHSGKETLFFEYENPACCPGTTRIVYK